MRIYIAVISLFFITMTTWLHGANYTGLIVGESIGNVPDSAIDFSTRGVIHGNRQPFTQVITTGNITVPNNTNFHMEFSSVVYNRKNNIFNQLPTTFHIHRGGIYNISCGIRWAPNATGYREVWILRVDPNERFASSRVAASVQANTRQTVTTIQKLVKGDRVRCMVRQGSGGNLAVQPDGKGTNFTILKVW